jgi:hypothetical protein
MTPEQGLAAQMIAILIDKLGATPILLFFAVLLLAPWCVAFWISRQQDKRMAKALAQHAEQFSAAVEMYKSNVVLVKNYEVFTAGLEKVFDKQQDLILLVSTTMQTLVDHIKSNLFCPFVRQSTQPGKLEGAPKL